MEEFIKYLEKFPKNSLRISNVSNNIITVRIIENDSDELNKEYEFEYVFFKKFIILRNVKLLEFGKTLIFPVLPINIFFKYRIRRNYADILYSTYCLIIGNEFMIAKFNNFSELN